MEVKITLCLRRGYALISTENERPWVHARLIDTRFNQGRAPENPGYRCKEMNLENYKTEQVGQTRMKIDGSNYPASQSVYAAVSSEFYIQNYLMSAG